MRVANGSEIGAGVAVTERARVDVRKRRENLNLSPRGDTRFEDGEKRGLYT
jgi:hypothetical protein